MVSRTKPRRGRVPGVQVGQMFGYRHDVRAAGLHGATQGGIYGCHKDGGAVSITVSGGYTANKDRGDEIEYTGQGEISSGQIFNKGNLGLASTCDAKLNKDGAVAVDVRTRLFHFTRPQTLESSKTNRTQKVAQFQAGQSHS